MASSLSLPRRHILQSAAGLLACCAPQNSARSQTPDVITGAIRWDAWYERADSSISAQDNLGPAKFHRRAPSHCTANSDQEIACVGTQKVMDAEIAAAAKAGIKFWAFVWYGPNTSLRTAWNLYQKSSVRGDVNWCGIVTPAALGSAPFDAGGWRDKDQEWADRMASPTYQKVDVAGERNRPLLFILWRSNEVSSFFGGKLQNVAKSIEYLRERALVAGLGRPYVVLLDGTNGAAFCADIGAEAIGNYTAGFRRERAAPYRDLDLQTRAYWTELERTGKPVVPIAMVGWDTRAREEHPGPFHSDLSPDIYYVLPQPAELAEHIRAAVHHIEENPQACASKVLLVYSWDECDEGGGLIPTLGDPAGSLLAAIAPILK